MSTRRIQDQEGAKTVIMSFKTVARASLAISRQNIKLICFADVLTGRLRVDADATTKGMQDGSAQGRTEEGPDLQDQHASRVNFEPGAMHIKGGSQRKEGIAYNDDVTVGPSPRHRQPTTRTRSRRGNAGSATSTATTAWRFTPKRQRNRITGTNNNATRAQWKPSPRNTRTSGTHSPIVCKPGPTQDHVGNHRHKGQQGQPRTSCTGHRDGNTTHEHIQSDSGARQRNQRQRERSPQLRLTVRSIKNTFQRP